MSAFSYHEYDMILEMIDGVRSHGSASSFSFCFGGVCLLCLGGFDSVVSVLVLGLLHVSG